MKNSPGYYSIEVFEKSRLKNSADRQFNEFKLTPNKKVNKVTGSVLVEGVEVPIAWDAKGISTKGKEFDLIIKNKMQAYIDSSDEEFSFHCLSIEHLEVMLSACKEQAGKANIYQDHISQLQKEHLTNLIKLIEDALNNK